MHRAKQIAPRGNFGSRLELCFVPRFPARPLCGEQDLAKVIRNTVVDRRQVQYPDLTNRLLSQHESVTVPLAAVDLRPGYSVFEANIWGMLFYGGPGRREVWR